MAYRANVTDKQQSDIERAADDSAIRLQWWKQTDGQTVTEGETKMIPAYDLSNTADAGGSPNDGVLQVSRAHMVVGSHNDDPSRFAEPGKA
jgi:hypothetical protein